MTAPDTDRIDTVLDILDAGLAPPSFADTHGMADALEAWTIDGERTATWAAAKLRRAQRKRNDAEATARELRALADEHVAKIERETDHDVRYFTGKLRQYHEGVTAGTRKHTTTVPGAKLSDRAGGVSVDVTDPDALVAWLEDHNPGAIKYADPTPDKTAVKGEYGAKVEDGPGAYPAVDVESGEVVPGVELVRGERSFSVVLTAVDADETEAE